MEKLPHNTSSNATSLYPSLYVLGFSSLLDSYKVNKIKSYIRLPMYQWCKIY